MALTDSNARFPTPASQIAGFPASGFPRDALARLPHIHAEASETVHLAGFLRAAVGAAAGLMVLGVLAVALTGEASLKQQFAWSLLMLAGVGAILRSYIKSTAQAFDRAPLGEAAKDLRAVLFYTGFAWGAGAFLVLGDNPTPALGLGFAMLPSLTLLPLLKDRAASMAFIGPVTLLTAAAIVLEHWSGTILALALLLFVQGSILLGLMLWPQRRRPALPAGLSLP